MTYVRIVNRGRLHYKSYTQLCSYISSYSNLMSFAGE